MTSYINPDEGTLVIKSVKDLDLSAIDRNDAALVVEGGEWIAGNLYVGGTFIANGDIVTLGNSGGVLTFNTNISSNVLPSATKTFNLGSKTECWKELHTETVMYNTDDIASTQVSSQASMSIINSSTSVGVTLDDGIDGQLKIITVSEPIASPVILLPVNPRGFSSISFTNAGDSATLMFINAGWNIISVFRSSVNL